MLNMSACKEIIDNTHNAGLVELSRTGEYVFKIAKIWAHEHNPWDDPIGFAAADFSIEEYELGHCHLIYVLIRLPKADPDAVLNITLTQKSTYQGFLSHPLRFPPMSKENYPEMVTLPLFRLPPSKPEMVRIGDVLFKGWFEPVRSLNWPCQCAPY